MILRPLHAGAVTAQSPGGVAPSTGRAVLEVFRSLRAPYRTVTLPLSSQRKSNGEIDRPAPKPARTRLPPASQGTPLSAAAKAAKYIAAHRARWRRSAWPTVLPVWNRSRHRHLARGRLAPGVAGEPLLARFQKLFRPAVIQTLGDALAAAQGGDALLAAQARHHDPDLLGCVSKVVEIGFGASPSGLSFAAVRPRGQGFRRRLADRGFPIHRLCASGFGRKRGAPRGASALFRDTAARSVF